jgi:hypothetical protein
MGLLHRRFKQRRYGCPPARTLRGSRQGGERGGAALACGFGGRGPSAASLTTGSWARYPEDGGRKSWAQPAPFVQPKCLLCCLRGWLSSSPGATTPCPAITRDENEFLRTCAVKGGTEKYAYVPAARSWPRTGISTRTNAPARRRSSRQGLERRALAITITKSGGAGVRNRHNLTILSSGRIGQLQQLVSRPRGISAHETA